MRAQLSVCFQYSFTHPCPDSASARVWRRGIGAVGRENRLRATSCVESKLKAGPAYSCCKQSSTHNDNHRRHNETVSLRARRPGSAISTSPCSYRSKAQRYRLIDAGSKLSALLLPRHSRLRRKTPASVHRCRTWQCGGAGVRNPCCPRPDSPAALSSGMSLSAILHLRANLCNKIRFSFCGDPVDFGLT